MMGHYEWYADRLGAQRLELHHSTDGLVGEIRRVGGSWQVIEFPRNGGTLTIGIRPDMISAKELLVVYMNGKSLSV